MNTIKRKKTDTIRELANCEGPCITLALAGDSPLEQKAALDSVRKKLKDRQAADIDALLAPIAAEAEGNKGGGVAIFRSSSLVQVHRLSSIDSLIRVDDRFDLRTLLCAIDEQKLFYILALSQNRARILRCTQERSEEIPFPAGFPTSLADAMQTGQPDTVSGNGNAASGISSADPETKPEYMLHYFSALNSAVNAALKDSGDPLIAAGVDREVALYHRVNTYPHLVEGGIHGAPDGLEGGEMHRRGLELLQAHADRQGVAVPADFDKRVGTGHASTHIRDIVAAAYEGRVSHLFFQANSLYSGVYDPVRQTVKHTEDPLHGATDLIETAAWETINRSGEVRLLPGSAMPNGVPVCALFRYPAAQNAVEPELAATTA